MAEEKDEQCIVCITVQYGNWNPRCVVEGSVKKQCNDCKTPVYLSKSGQALLVAAPQTKLFCMNCVQKELEIQKAKGEEIKAAVLPGALDEALDNIKRRNNED